ncbi:MAG: PKD domain-containing protein [Bacteroidales bacterium]|nr:PKD domain-containing protein [Bacteroidales bacterium]
MHFNATGSVAPEGSIVSYEWNLGNGSAATGDTTSTTYGASGNYEATLVVTSSNGLTDSAITVINVSEYPASNPIAQHYGEKRLSLD